MSMPVIYYPVSLCLLILPLGVILINLLEIMSFSANIHRALSRLKSIFVIRNTAESMQYKEANNLFHPIAVKVNDGYGIEHERSFQVQIGSKIMSEYPLSSVTETLDQLGKTVGYPLHIYGRWFRSHRYLIGLDSEKSAVLFLLDSLRKAEIKLRLISRIVMLKVGLRVSLLGCIVLYIAIVFLISKIPALKFQIEVKLKHRT